MELDYNTYDLICEQLQQCLLPELDRDIGNEALEKEDFGIFRYGLEMNLKLIFDIIAKNEQIILHPFENDNRFRQNFVLLIHQQSGYDEAPFQTDSQSISKQIHYLTEKYYKQLINVPEIQQQCLQYYKDRLTTDKWKRNVGAVYGFIHMCKVLSSLIGNSKPILLISNWYFIFIVSVYSYIRNCLTRNLSRTHVCLCCRLECS